MIVIWIFEIMMFMVLSSWCGLARVQQVILVNAVPLFVNATNGNELQRTLSDLLPA